MADTTNMYVIDEAGLEALATQILNKVNIRIKDRIVNTVDETSDAEHTASAAAVYSAIASASAAHVTTPISAEQITAAVDAAFAASDPSTAVEEPVEDENAGA